MEGAKHLKNYALYSPLLLKIINSTDSSNGHLFEQLCDITYKSDDSCTDVLNLLLYLLKYSSNDANQNVKQSLNFLIQHGSSTFRIELRKKDGELRASNVQKLCQQLFDPELIMKDENPSDCSIRREKSLSQTGYGSSASETGKYAGFGKSSSMKMSFFDQAQSVLKNVISTNSDAEFENLKSTFANGDVGNYQPYIVSPELLESLQDTSSGKEPNSNFYFYYYLFYICILISLVLKGCCYSDELSSVETTHRTLSGLPELPLLEEGLELCILHNLLEENKEWPINYNSLLQFRNKLTFLNNQRLLEVMKNIAEKVLKVNMETKFNENEKPSESCVCVMVLFLIFEQGIFMQYFSSKCELMFIQEVVSLFEVSECFHSIVRKKMVKLLTLIKKLLT